MRKLREVLRLRFDAGLSIRQISARSKISFPGRCPRTCMTRPWRCDCTQGLVREPSTKFQQPVWTEIHQELKKKGVTKQLLWEKYTQHIKRVLRINQPALSTIIFNFMFSDYAHQ